MPLPAGQHPRTKANTMTDLSALLGAPAPATTAQPLAAPAPAPAPVPQVQAPAPAIGGDWLDAIVTAEARNGGGAPYANEPGTVIGKVTSIKEVETQEGGKAITLEYEVVATSTPEPYAVGTSWCMFREVPGKFKAGASDVKGWLECLLHGAMAERGQPAPAFSRQILEMAVGPQQIFAGAYVKIRSFFNGSGTFTKYQVEYVPRSQVEGAT